MSSTILEVLKNAEYNLNGKMPSLQTPLAKAQLSNAIKALENGWDLDNEYDEYMTTEKSDSYKRYL